MRTIAVILVLSVCLTLPAKGQSTIPPYHTHNDFLLASPGALKTGLFGYDNPALGKARITLVCKRSSKLFFIKM